MTLTHNIRQLNKAKRDRDLAICVCVILFAFLVGPIYEKSKIISPCPESGCFVKTVYAKDEASQLQQIIDYIVLKFSPEGDRVVTQALSCFISESHLNPKAYHYNSNNTWDYGVAQWNQVHGQTIDQLQDWKHQIDLAFDLYKSSHSFSQWYGSGCH